jgi:hypothetical protein
MDILDNEFLLFLDCASKNSLSYLLIGGYAVNYYGYARNTKDMDIWLEPTNNNRSNFIQTLLCMGYSEQEVSPLLNEDFTQLFKATIGPPSSAIDFLTYVHKDLSFTEAFQNHNRFEVKENLYMQIVPYEMLKEMKLRTGREKDYFDIARLEELKNNQ